MKTTPSITNIITTFIILGISIISWHKIYIQSINSGQEEQQFDGGRAFQDVDFQVSLGPRIPGTQAHRQIVEWITIELESAGWDVEIQQGEILENKVTNVIGKRGTEHEPGRPWIILGAHFDTRIYSDRDPNPEKRTHPVPGANDGASGVAVLLELARILPKSLYQNLWLVFFDAEDNGNIEGWDWILGSRFFVQSLYDKPDAAIIVDMVGDADLNIFMEQGSDPVISSEIWAVAGELGFSQFKPIPKYRILDDHVPFLESGIKAVDIIDFDYPSWHTSNDTTEKVSAKSLEAVGETLRVWLLRADP